MKTYLNLLKYVLDNGEVRDQERTGNGTISVFDAPDFVHDMRNGFPILSTKKIHWASVVNELVWFLRGNTNIKWLVDRKVNIWTKDAYRWHRSNVNKFMAGESVSSKQYMHYLGAGMFGKELLDVFGCESFDEGLAKFTQLIKDSDKFASVFGDIGPVYGASLRNFGYEGKYDYTSKSSESIGHVDQFKQLIDGLTNNPQGRRHIMTTWNPMMLDHMALPPCHGIVIQFYVSDGGLLHLKMYQRSADAFLGVPFNISSYGLLLMIVGKLTGYTPATMRITFGDLHIYQGHIEQVKDQLSREPIEQIVNVVLPKIGTYMISDWLQVSYPQDDYVNLLDNTNVTLENYKSYDAIKATMYT